MTTLSTTMEETVHIAQREMFTTVTAMTDITSPTMVHDSNHETAACGINVKSGENTGTNAGQGHQPRIG